MTGARGAIWVPSLFVGAAVATSLATGAGVLLYDSEGVLRTAVATSLATGAGVLLRDSQELLRAAAVLLGVAAVSLIAGLRMGVADHGEVVPSAARWWVGFLVALLVGAGFSALWEQTRGFGSAAAAQGLGLAVTAALPAYFAGGVWGRIGSFASSLGVGERLQVVAGGVLGVAAGSVLVIAILGRPVLAVTAFLGAVVLASAGARFQGWLFDRVPRRRLVLADPARPELCFEAWHTAVPEAAVRVLMDAGRDRVVDPPPVGDWRAGVAATLDTAGPVLFVGAGSWFAAVGDREWSLYEPDAGLRALAARGFGWDEGSLADSPIPRGASSTVVADWETAGETAAHSIPSGELLAALRDAEVERVWIHAPHGRIPGSLMESAANAGCRVARYRGAVEGTAGPPRLAPRGDELWCLDWSAAPAPAVRGMQILTGEGGDLGGGSSR